MDSHTTPEKAAARKAPSSALSELLGCIISLGAAWWLYSTFTELETSGGTVRVPWLVSLAYDFGGKWPVIGICLLAAGAYGKDAFKAVAQNRW